MPASRDEALTGQIVARAGAADYEAWWASVEHSGYCTNPVQLTGKDPAGRPITVLGRCGNRRAAVCPSCSDLYAADTWQLVHAGVAGGRHGLPASITGRPLVFLTLTAPGFGPVHTRHVDPARPCRARSRGVGPRCAHGRPTTCRLVHRDADSLLGTALCIDCHDYVGQTLFAWHLPALWHRFVISLRREIARELRRIGQPSKALRLSYVKAAEMQRRGVPHHHILLRLDPAGSPVDETAEPLPPVMTAVELAGVACRVALAVRLTVPAPGGTTTTLRFGEQLDAQPLGTSPDDSIDGDDTRPTGRKIANYLAKYCTKSVADLGLGPRRITEKAIDTLAVTDHVRAILRSVVALADDPGPPEMVRWLHTLGYHGHITTKTRHYSTTMTALRAQRREWRTDASHDSQGSGSGSGWTFAGHGHADDAERHLARSAALKARQTRQAARETLRDRLDEQP